MLKKEKAQSQHHDPNQEHVNGTNGIDSGANTTTPSSPPQSVPASPSSRKVQFYYLVCSCTYLTSMWASNAALSFVNYPAQVLVKSCKILPVMFMGIVVLRRKYTPREYFCVLSITIGIVLFTLKKISLAGFMSGSGDPAQDLDKSTKTYFHIVGVLLCILSLGLDGFTSAFEEKINSDHKPSSTELMFQMNLWASIFLFIALLGSQSLIPAIYFCLRNRDVLVLLVGLATTSAFGQFFVFYSLNIFGSLWTSIITTTRKFFTILFSVFYFGHVLTPVQWAGVILIFTGLTWDVHSKFSCRNSNHHHSLDSHKPKHQ